MSDMTERDPSEGVACTGGVARRSRPPRMSTWKVLNSPFFITLFTSVAVALVSYLWAERQKVIGEERQRAGAIREANAELMYRSELFDALVARNAYLRGQDVSGALELLSGTGQRFGAVVPRFKGTPFLGVVVSRDIEAGAAVDGAAGDRWSCINCRGAIAEMHRLCDLASGASPDDLVNDHVATGLRKAWKAAWQRCVVRPGSAEEQRCRAEPRHVGPGAPDVKY